jgi:group I intron endonuclease
MRYCNIYLLKNIINGKVYIGQTWVSYHERMKNGAGYKGSQLMHNAIQKYGVSNFEYTTLKTVDNQNDADYWENYYINEYNSFNSEVGYNLLTGRGALGKHSETTKIKLSEINMGHEVSEETKNKISQSLIGNVPWNKGKIDVYAEEVRKKISDSLKGHVISQETRNKISEANSGENHPLYGKKHTEESRNKMSETRKNIVGEDANGSKFTQEQADQIRKEYLTVGSYSKLSRKYNVHAKTIKNIIMCLTYKQIK